MKISVIIPLYMCEPFIVELIKRLKKTLIPLTDEYEIILVNDASPLNDWLMIKEEAMKDINIKGINLSRNFGQHYAITAGLDAATGDWIVVMDGDLQDQPEDITKLYKLALKEDFDVVWGRRTIRKHHFVKRLTSKLFYKLFDFLSGYKTDPTVANYSIVRRKVVEAYKQMREHNRAYPMFVRWTGFNHGFINIDHAKRTSGRSSYNIRRLFKLAFEATIAYSNKPLRIGLFIGVIMSFGSLVFALYFVFKHLIRGIPVPGYTSMIVSIWFIGGLLMAFLGLLGLYIGKIFDEGKNRPLYFISNTINL